MSSTEDATDALEQLFARFVVPAAEALRARDQRFFALSASEGDATYFVDRRRRALSPADFEWPIVRTPADLAARLRELWSDQPELLALVDRLAALASYRTNEVGDDGSVSELVYPMY